MEPINEIPRSQDFSKIINRVIVGILLLVVIAMTATYAFFGAKDYFKKPEPIAEIPTSKDWSAEEREVVIGDLESLPDPVTDDEALKKLKVLPEASGSTKTPQEREDILRNL